jgi:cystathionine beta-lyase/cystathionine gamma-synthase
LLEDQLAEKDKTVKELERQVKESLVALSEFKQEAIEARSELINKESELSITHTRMDPQDCLQELLKELEDRRYD